MSDDPVDRQYDALIRLNDELMSMPHAAAFRDETIPTAIVRGWLRELVVIVDEGLGKSSPRHWQ